MNFDIISRVEIVYHVGSGLFIAVVKDIILRIHGPFDLMDFVRPVRSIFCHYDGTLEFSLHEILVVAREPILD
jgi:hypothetical protein